MKPLYVHKQEIWDEKKCAQVAKRKGRDGCGTLHPYPGLVASSGSAYPQYGQAVRYNGGCIREGELYQAEQIPLPQIPDTYEFYDIITWGTYLRKKA